MTSSAELTLWPLVILPVLGLVWIAVNRKLFSDPLSPFNLVFFSWVAPGLLQVANLSYLEVGWSLRSALIVGWVTFVLVAVSVGASAFVSRRLRTPGSQSAYATLLAMLREPRFLVPFVALHVATMGVYLFVEFVTNPAGIPLVTSLLGGTLSGVAIHRWGKDSRWQALVALLFVLTPIAFLAFKANRGRPVRILLLFMALLYPALGVLKLSRSDVFIGMLTILVVAAYHRAFTDFRERNQAGRLLRFAAVTVIGLAIYYAMMAIRISSVPVEDIYARMIGFRVSPDVPLRGLMAALYGYLAMPFENLHRMIDANPQAFHPGVSVFRPFLSIAGLGSLADQLDARVVYPPAVSAAAGSATFLTAVIAELGVLGTALIPLAYALLVNTLYVRMRNGPTFLNLLLYVNFVYPWMWLFFNNAFGVLSIYINAAFVVVVGLLQSELLAQRIRFATAPVH